MKRKNRSLIGLAVGMSGMFAGSAGLSAQSGGQCQDSGLAFCNDSEQTYGEGEFIKVDRPIYWNGVNGWTANSAAETAVNKINELDQQISIDMLTSHNPFKYKSLKAYDAAVKKRFTRDSRELLSMSKELVAGGHTNEGLWLIGHVIGDDSRYSQSMEINQRHMVADFERFPKVQPEIDAALDVWERQSKFFTAYFENTHAGKSGADKAMVEDFMSYPIEISRSARLAQLLGSARTIYAPPNLGSAVEAFRGLADEPEEAALQTWLLLRASTQ